MGDPNKRKCYTCGGDLIPDGRGVLTCDHCGRPDYNAEGGFSHELNEIVNRRQLREFIQAEELCRELQRNHPESSEVYWQTLLATLGVVYVHEGSKAKPTFFSYSYDDRETVLNNENYLNAVKYAQSSADREYYETHAKELDDLLNEFFGLVAKEDSYDIFISFRSSEDAIVNNEKKRIQTDDSMKAKEIFDYFSQRYRVFFSPVSIGKDTGLQGEKYEPRILKALQTSQAMILLGSRTEYLEAQWVQNEWRRFKYFIDKGKKNKAALILGYEKFMPSLPVALKDIQLPSFDWYKNGYLQELESKLAFVRSSKGIKSALKNRKVNSDFGTEASFGGGYSGKRVAIAGKANGLVLSASEERELELAESALSGGHFSNARSLFESILQKNPNNANAYWGRFKSIIKARRNSDVPHAIIAKGTEEYFGDIDSAIDISNDEKFSWLIVDLLIQALNENVDWSKRKKVYEAAIKYLDDTRIVKVLNKLSDIACGYLNSNIKAAEEVFDSSRKLFFEENKSEVFAHLRKFADGLYERKHYDLARKYYEELAGGQRNAEVYMCLLGCRLKTQDVTTAKFSLNVNPDDDASTKKPSELDLDEIIERAIICTTRKNSDKIDEQIQKIILYQVLHNRGNVKPFIETAISCYDQMGDDQKSIQLLLSVSELFIQTKQFKQAHDYYNEVLSRDPNYSKAHWGLLMCRFKVISEVELAKKRKHLLDLPEYTNAVSCATESEFRHYTDILNGKVSSDYGSSNKFNNNNKNNTNNNYNNDASIGLNKQAYMTYKANRVKIMSLIAFLIVLPILLFGIVSIILSAFGVGAFYTFWNVLALQMFGNPILQYVFLAIIIVLLIVVISLKRKRRRRLRSFVFNIILCVVFIGFTIYGGTTVRTATSGESDIYVGDGFIAYYSENNKGYTLEKLYYGIGTTDIVLPSEHNGKKVTFLGDAILSENLGKVSVTLPDTISAINRGTFRNSENLVYIDIPESVTEIAEGAFYGCNNLEGISLPFVGEKTTIGGGKANSVFGYIFGTPDENEIASIDATKQNYSGNQSVDYYIPMSLTEVTVKGGSLYYGAFYNCSNLTSITICDDVKSIGSNAFFKCSSLESLTLPFVGSTKDGKNNAYFGYIFGANSSTKNNDYVPSSLKTVKITGGTVIANNAFYGCSNLTTVELPDTIMSIGENAFDGCTGLKYNTVDNGIYLGNADNPYFALMSVKDDEVTSFTINSKTKIICDYAFDNCRKLTSIAIPNSVTGIGNSAFRYCYGLTSVTVGSAVKSIGSYAFNNCNHLESIVLPDSVTSIGEGAFFYCINLKSISVPFIGATKDEEDDTTFSYIFGGDVPSSLQSVKVTGGTSIKSHAFSNCYNIISIELPNSIKSIGEYAFYHCSDLESLELPDSVTSIGEYAFEYCSSLENIELPASVTSIGKYAFGYCSGLESIKLSASVTSIEEFAFYYCNSLTDIELPASVKSIGTNAFGYCKSLTSIKIPSSVTSIANRTFFNCDSLESVELPDSIESIGAYAFYYCTSLENIVIPSSVEEIGNYAFGNCISLENIEIPVSVTSIGAYAFQKCTGLTDIVIPDSVTSIGESAFGGCSKLESITLPFVGATKDGKSNTHFGYIFGAWTSSDNSSNVPNSLKIVKITGGTIIDNSAFNNCLNLTTVELPDSITSIGNYAFNSCSALADITLGNSVTSIGTRAFYYCGKLTDIELPDSLTSIGNEAFRGCVGLVSVTVGDSVETIDESAFYGCSKLASIDIPDSVKSLGRYAFYNCSSLTSALVGKSVTSIGESAFYGCNKLASITLPFVGATKNGTSNTNFGYIFGTSSYSYHSTSVPSTLKTVSITGGSSLENNAFRNCSNITSITLPNSITRIYDNVFYSCSSLKSITMPNAITLFGGSVFYGCSSLTSIELPNTITSVPSYTFYNCSGLTSVTIGSKVTSIATYAFYGCNKLESIVIPSSVTSMGNYAFTNCSKLTIYCEASSKPSGWSSNWNSSNRPVQWGYTKPQA